MRIQTISLLLLTLALGAHAQERTTDLLAPITQCVNSDGFHDKRKDRLPVAAKSRRVALANGVAQVSTEDGYRLMVYRNSSSPLVNLKIERSVDGQFANDRQVIIQQLKELAASAQGPTEIKLETSTQHGLEILAINNPDIDHIDGVISLYTLLDAAHDTVATAYVLNQAKEVREFATNAEYVALRDRFITLLGDCMSR